MADMLSRYPTISVDTLAFEEVTTLQNFSFPATILNIKKSQDSITNLPQKILHSSIYTSKVCEGVNIIYRNGKIVLDPILFSDILAWYHVNLNHPGQDRTYKTINSVFYTPNMEAKVRQYVDQCQVCKKSKISKKKWSPS